jgi:hypothetical protein
MRAAAEGQPGTGLAQGGRLLEYIDREAGIEQRKGGDQATQARAGDQDAGHGRMRFASVAAGQAKHMLRHIG